MGGSRLAEFEAEGLRWSEERLWPQFARHAATHPDALALVDAVDRRWTYGEVSRLATGLSERLAAAGVTAGMRVLVEGGKHAGTLATALAVSALEAAFCPYSPKLTVADRTTLEDRLRPAARVIADAAGDADILPGAQTAAIDPDAVLIGFTSGSTGVPKGVRHGATALNYATLACSSIADLGPQGSILGIVPLDSAPGFTFTAHFALSQGRALVMVDPWDPVVAMRRATDHGCEWAIMVPTHLYTMVEAARCGAWKGRLSLQAAAVGGSAMTPELIADADRLLGLKALRMFGMSECMGHCSTRPSDILARRQSTDGRPFPGTVEEAFGDSGTALPRGSRGQAGVRGPSLFLGYAEGLGAGEENLTADGHYLTGDEIVRDEEGFVKVVGRIKDQIIRGGFNIDPAEIEASLLRHSNLAEVVVVGIPERKLGEQACAVCRIRKDAPSPSLQDLLDHLENEGVSRKKWPEHMMVVDDMTVGSTGKVDKREMARRAKIFIGQHES
jgi:acyl-CoA synthetase